MNNNVLKKNSKIISFRKDCILISKKDFYGYHPLIPLAALAAIALLFLFLTIARLKRTYRQKDQ